LAFGGGGSSTPETLPHTHAQGVAGDGGDLSETLTDMNGVLLYSLITDNSAAVAANTAAIAAINSVPAGVILMWSGAVVDIPSGWNICDGTAGTVNLSNKFVRSGTSIGTTGGADTVTLTGAESGLVSHSHSSSVSDPGHVHTFQGGNGPSQGGSGDTPWGSYYNTTSATTGISVSVGTAGPTAASSAHENMPAYYELAYIQKS